MYKSTFCLWVVAIAIFIGGTASADRVILGVYFPGMYGPGVIGFLGLNVLLAWEVFRWNLLVSILPRDREIQIRYAVTMITVFLTWMGPEYPRSGGIFSEFWVRSFLTNPWFPGDSPIPLPVMLAGIAYIASWVFYFGNTAFVAKERKLWWEHDLEEEEREDFLRRGFQPPPAP